MEAQQKTPAQTFGVLISQNGSKWAGDSPDQLSKLLDMLATHPLDRSFENYGNFCSEPRLGVRDEDAQGRPIWVDGDLIYPEQPYVVRFWGNFHTHSHCFEIDTDDAEVIDALLEAIAANKRRPDYLAQAQS
jgi:hypothetical protein